MWRQGRGAVRTSVGVGGRGFLEALRLEFQANPGHDTIRSVTAAESALTQIPFSPFLLSSTLQPMACLTSWWQHSQTPSIQEQGWYFCRRSLLQRTTAHR